MGCLHDTKGTKMTNELAILTRTDAGDAITIVPPDATGNRLSRLSLFENWLQDAGQDWHKPNLAAYRDALLERGLQATSIRAHLSTIRARYKAIIRDNATRDVLHTQAAELLQAAGEWHDTPANRTAMVDEVITRLENAIHPSASAVTVETVQDETDAEHIRLNLAQAQALVDAPGLLPLQQLRDTAIIALLLATGIREAELCALDVADLRQTVNGVLGLHVRKGKGSKTRFIPYGAFQAVLVVVDRWRELAGITEGAVFRGLWKGGRTIRDNRLSPRQVQRILARYPVAVNGHQVTLAPHDCRRSYAYICYTELGMDILALSQNLGHASIETTKNYIGDLTMDKRAPTGRVFRVNLAELDALYRQAELDA